MTIVPPDDVSVLERIRETLVVGIIAVLIAVTVYAALGFAWTFKTAFETTQRLRHPFSSTS